RHPDLSSAVYSSRSFPKCVTGRQSRLSADSKSTVNCRIRMHIRSNTFSRLVLPFASRLLRQCGGQNIRIHPLETEFRSVPPRLWQKRGPLQMPKGNFAWCLREVDSSHSCDICVD